MMTYEQEQKMIADAAREFPATFGLRAFPGETFRISLRSSYISEGRVLLYTEVRKPGDRWLSFAKGTPRELQREVVICSCGEGNDAGLGHCDGCAMRTN